MKQTFLKAYKYRIYPNSQQKVQKRQQVLRHFLETQPLYQTPFFQKRYGRLAKQNLAQALGD